MSIKQGDCFNKALGSWKSYKLKSPASGDRDEQYLRTWKKKNCEVGNGQGKFDDCKHAGPNGGLSENACVTPDNPFSSISQSNIKCPD
jgi:hypothetical protein